MTGAADRRQRGDMEDKAKLEPSSTVSVTADAAISEEQLRAGLAVVSEAVRHVEANGP